MITENDLDNFIKNNHLYFDHRMIKFDEKDSGYLFHILYDVFHNGTVAVYSCNDIGMVPGEHRIGYCGHGPLQDSIKDLQTICDKFLLKRKELIKKIRLSKIKELQYVL